MLIYSIQHHIDTNQKNSTVFNNILVVSLAKDPFSPHLLFKFLCCYLSLHFSYPNIDLCMLFHNTT